MSQQQTTMAERHQMIDLKVAGHTLREVAQQMGWSYATVRHWWRRYRDHGRSGLTPPDRRTQRGGPMSTFPGVVRFAMLRVKLAHPGWGAAVVRPRVAQRLDVPVASLPSVSTIEKYWATFGRRLYRPHRPRHPAQPRVVPPAVSAVHERWQADFKVRMQVAGLGRVDVFNIRDEVSPLKVGATVWPYEQYDIRQIQHALRRAFTRWGLPDRFQSDADKRLVAKGDHPFPTRFTLWLAGLGIVHDVAPSAPHNGCVERFHRTWYQRVVVGRTFDSLAHLQAVSDEECQWINYQLPSQGRACAGQPPVVAYPATLSPRRPFQPAQESQLFSLQRVYETLADYTWWRRVSTVGQVRLGGFHYSVGRPHAGQEVRITFDADAARFEVFDTQHHLIKEVEPHHLTADYLIGQPTS